MNFEQFVDIAGHSTKVLVDGYQYDHMRFTTEGVAFNDDGDTNAITFDKYNFEQARPVGEELEVDDDNGYIHRIKCLKVLPPVADETDRFTNGIVEGDVMSTEDDPSSKLYGKNV